MTLLDPQLASAYAVLAAALAVTPGPDTLFVVASAMRHRMRGAIASAFGVAAGTFGHSLMAAIGVSAVIAAAPGAFDLLKYGGAAYLLWLGFRSLDAFRRGAPQPAQPEGMAPIPAQVRGRAVFTSGFLTNLMNPKVIVFYLALLPQFVNPALGHPGLQVFLLGMIHTAFGLTFLLVAGFSAGKASEWIARTGFMRWLDGLAGVFFIAIALRLALSRPQ